MKYIITDYDVRVAKPDLVWNDCQVFGAPRGVVTLTLREHRAKSYTVGNYVEHEGRLWRVARRVPSSDWFSDEIHVRLEGAHYEPAGAPGMFRSLLSRLPLRGAVEERINWLDDDAFTIKLDTTDPGGRT